MQLVLASSSPYRRELLRHLGLPFVWEAPQVDESAYPGEQAETLCRRLALSKAQDLAARYHNAQIIGSDQVCVCEGAMLGKPGDAQAAREQLRLCSGRTAVFHTALVLLDTHTGRWQEALDLFSVDFRELSIGEIDAYVDRENPLDCAGSFKAEGLGIALFSAMRGKDFHSLLGLPLISLCDLLRTAGLNPLAPDSQAGG